MKNYVIVYNTTRSKKPLRSMDGDKLYVPPLKSLRVAKKYTENKLPGGVIIKSTHQFVPKDIKEPESVSVEKTIAETVQDEKATVKRKDMKKSTKSE